MTTYFMSTEVLARAVDQWQGSAVLGPLVTERLPWLDSMETSGVSSTSILEALRQPRAAQSLKGAMLPASESLGQYGPQGSTVAAIQTAATVVLGVRACELRALEYLDKVFLAGTFDDPSYRARRQRTTLVSCDCATFAETCFCTLVGGRPFATGGYDVNLTPLEDGWLVDVASDGGRKFFGPIPLAPATPEQLARREDTRRRMIQQVADQNTSFTFSASDTAAAKLPEGGDDGWQKFAADCVECGGCTNICPTCHCFYLYDQTPGPSTFERVRTWDSCLLNAYHRMAGGVHMKLSPRPLLLSRLANRVLHKYVYSAQQYGLVGCTGCGRCIDACPGAIDIRRVVQELAR